MPPNRNRNSPPRQSRGASATKPPDVMTRSSVIFIVTLALAVLFDALRFMFEWFIIFGPALLGAACTIGANSALGTSVGGTTGQMVGGVCVAASAVAGFFGAGVTEAFGMVMAEVTGLAGWLILGLLLVMFNARIFKENALWFGASLLLSEVPFLGSLPFFTGTLWKMYSTQIRVEKAAYKKWEAENAAHLRQERDRQALEQSQFLQQQHAEQQSEFDNEWQGQMAQHEDQEAQETDGDEFGGMQLNQQGAENEEEVSGQPTVESAPPQRQIIQPKIGGGSSESVAPPPITHDYGMQGYPPPRPQTQRLASVQQYPRNVAPSVRSSLPPHTQEKPEVISTPAVVKPEVEERLMYRGTGAGGLHPKEGSVIYVSPSEEFASERATFLHKDKATTHTVRVRVKNTFDYENEDHVARLNTLLNTPASTEARVKEAARLNPGVDPEKIKVLLQQMAPGRISKIRRGEWDAIESSHIKQALQKLGFDSFYVREVVDGKSYKNLGVFDASKVAPEATDVTPETSLPPPTTSPVAPNEPGAAEKNKNRGNPESVREAV